MGFFARLWDLIRGNANAALSRAEDPEKVLDIIIKDASSEVEKFRNQVSRALVDQKRLQAELQTAVTSVNEWSQRAEAAVSAGDDNLAREALVRRAQEEQVGRLKFDAARQHGDTVAQLKDALRAMTAKLEDAKRRRTLLVARSRNAQAQKKLAGALGGAGGTALDRFDEMEAKVETMEMEAATSVEMLSEFGDRDLKKRFESLATQSPSVEAALLEIKSKKALAAGSLPMLPGSKEK